MINRLRIIFLLTIFGSLLAQVHGADVIWSKRAGQAATVFEDKIWVAGGNTEVGPESEWKAPQPSKNDVWNSPDGIHWTRVTASAPWPGRAGHAFVAFKGQLWLLGGMTRNGPRDAWLNDVWSSKDGKNWKCVVDKAPWSIRSNHRVVVYKDKLWLLSGYVGSLSGLCRDIWSSEDGKSWIKVLEQTPWFARRDKIAAFVFNDKLTVIESPNKVSQLGFSMIFNEVWTSENGSEWKCIADYTPICMDEFEAVVNYDAAYNADIIWVFGGLSGSGYLSQVWSSQYGRDWFIKTCCAPWGIRSRQNALVFKKNIYLLGGLSGTLYNDVWRSKDGRHWIKLKPQEDKGSKSKTGNNGKKGQVIFPIDEALECRKNVNLNAGGAGTENPTQAGAGK